MDMCFSTLKFSSKNMTDENSIMYGEISSMDESVICGWHPLREWNIDWFSSDGSKDIFLVFLKHVSLEVAIHEPPY